MYTISNDKTFKELKMSHKHFDKMFFVIEEIKDLEEKPYLVWKDGKLTGIFNGKEAKQRAENYKTACEQDYDGIL